MILTIATEPCAAEAEREAVTDGPECHAPGQAGPSLWLARLALKDFRNYRRAELAPDARPLVLTGPNGAGKTNLLEAVSLLAPGRGLRRARLGEVERRSAAEDGTAKGRTAEGRTASEDSSASWAVAAEVMTPDGRRSLGTGLVPAAGTAAPRERRSVKIDGDFVRGQQALSEIMALAWVTPTMDGLFREGASVRRRFLDRLVYGFDPAHAARIAAYEHALRERSRLLRSGAGEAAWLDGLEDGLARHGVAIAAARRDLVARLAGACAAGVGPFPKAGLGLSGEVESWLAELPALEVEDRLRARLGAARPRDAESGGAGLGPHRSDLVVVHLDKGLPAEVGSTGEQKALLLSIVLAHARLLALARGQAPVLLLDEVAAHLDEVRRVALFAEILALGAQAWMTGTDAGLFAALGDSAQFFEVHDARVRPAARAVVV